MSTQFLIFYYKRTPLKIKSCSLVEIIVSQEFYLIFCTDYRSSLEPAITTPLFLAIQDLKITPRGNINLLDRYLLPS